VPADERQRRLKLIRQQIESRGRRRAEGRRAAGLGDEPPAGAPPRPDAVPHRPMPYGIQVDVVERVNNTLRARLAIRSATGQRHEPARLERGDIVYGPRLLTDANAIAHTGLRNLHAVSTLGAQKLRDARAPFANFPAIGAVRCALYSVRASAMPHA
jgi:hypothetical protein